MTLSKRHKLLVVNSFLAIAPESEKLAARFYNRLFELAPEVKPLFKGDMTEQGHKLMQIIHIAVNSLNRFDTLIPQLQALGKRHITYGITLEQYVVVGEALVWALHDLMGDTFNDETREAWIAVYREMVNTATTGLYNN